MPALQVEPQGEDQQSSRLPQEAAPPAQAAGRPDAAAGSRPAQHSHGHEGLATSHGNSTSSPEPGEIEEGVDGAAAAAMQTDAPGAFAAQPTAPTPDSSQVHQGPNDAVRQQARRASAAGTSGAARLDAEGDGAAPNLAAHAAATRQSGLGVTGAGTPSQAARVAAADGASLNRNGIDDHQPSGDAPSLASLLTSSSRLLGPPYASQGAPPPQQQQQQPQQYQDVFTPWLGAPQAPGRGSETFSDRRQRDGPLVRGMRERLRLNRQGGQGGQAPADAQPPLTCQALGSGWQQPAGLHPPGIPHPPTNTAPGHHRDLWDFGLGGMLPPTAAVLGGRPGADIFNAVPGNVPSGAFTWPGAPLQPGTLQQHAGAGPFSGTFLGPSRSHSRHSPFQSGFGHQHGGPGQQGTAGRASTLQLDEFPIPRPRTEQYLGGTGQGAAGFGAPFGEPLLGRESSQGAQGPHEEDYEDQRPEPWGHGMGPAGPSTSIDRDEQRMEQDEGGEPGDEAEQAVPMGPGPSEETGEGLRGDGPGAEAARRADMRARNRIASVEHRRRRKVRHALKGFQGLGDVDLIASLGWQHTLSCIPNISLWRALCRLSVKRSWGVC